MSLDADNLTRLFGHFGLPKQYFAAITLGKAAGAHMVYLTRLESGKLQTLQYVIRVPHRPLDADNSLVIWSLAISWDAETQRSNCFFVGAGDDEIQLFRHSLQHWLQFCNHPLVIALVLIGILLENYTRARQKYDLEVSKIEKASGLRGNAALVTDPSQWSQDGVRKMAGDITLMGTHTAYIERRLDFAIKLCQFLLKCCATLSSEAIDPAVRRANDAIERELENDLSCFSNQLHQVQCLQKRSATVLNVVFSIVAERQSSTTIEIATESKRDSSSMITIAVVTTLFLLATYVASLFGTNMFDFVVQKFDRPLSHMFWLYWAITIPLTVVVLLTAFLWMRRRNMALAKDV